MCVNHYKEENKSAKREQELMLAEEVRKIEAKYSKCKVNPMPTVTYQGKTYKLRSRKTEIPDLEAMDSLEAHVWLNRNTTAKGYKKEPALVLPNSITISAK